MTARLYPQNTAPKNQRHNKVKPLALAISLACVAALTVSAHALAEQGGNSHHYQIDASPLTQCLNNFAAISGVHLSADAELTRGKSCAGVEGNLSIEQALTQLLKNTGLQASQQSDGSYALQAQGDANTLPSAKVSADVLEQLAVGTAAEGYLSETVSAVGPWQGRALQDTPYSVNVVSEEFIQNLQATNLDRVYKLNPVVQLNWPSRQNEGAYLNLRGFHASNKRNGIDTSLHGTIAEELGAIEVLTGSSGFLYGVGSVGGTVNYVTKRPTDERYNAITAGTTSGSNVYLHGDFGGRLGSDDQFGYRINAVTQDGETSVEDLNEERDSFSLAFDWQITDDLLLQIDGSKRDGVINRQSTWRLADGAVRPDAEDLDASKLWSQKWAVYGMDTERLGANLRWDITENISLRGGYLDEVVERYNKRTNNTIEADGTYSQWTINYEDSPERIYRKGGYAFANLSFDTGSVSHKLTAGGQFDDRYWSSRNDGFSSTTLAIGLPLTQPTYLAEPDWDAPGIEAYEDGFFQDRRNFSIGDDISFNEQWSALIGISRAEVKTYDGWSPDYEDSATTPACR